MSTTARKTTADDLFALSDDGFRYELVAGEIRRMTPGGSEHGVISMELGLRLAQHVRTRRLGVVFCAETGFLISRDPDTVLAPDAAFVRRERIETIGIPKSYFPEAPALVVEVASPNDTIELVDTKMRRWLNAGVELAWVVHPAGRTVTVYQSIDEFRVLTEKDMLSGDEIVSGFTCPVSDLFTGLASP